MRLDIVDSPIETALAHRPPDNRLAPDATIDWQFIALARFWADATILSWVIFIAFAAVFGLMVALDTTLSTSAAVSIWLTITSIFGYAGFRLRKLARWHLRRQCRPMVQALEDAHARVRPTPEEWSAAIDVIREIDPALVWYGVEKTLRTRTP